MISGVLKSVLTTDNAESLLNYHEIYESTLENPNSFHHILLTSTKVPENASQSLPGFLQHRSLSSAAPHRRQHHQHQQHPPTPPTTTHSPE
ncbi:hypothetical protein E2C01_077358 [Portunus trituberculatus]|uniref:Uncharacterized protein n=1 Tax=Portunus trituberculatus TaxID=210409 RepID=A0A5B7IL76_PORTR|nr:hypothetical protein [Portunus trituberculatus]